MKRLIFLLLSIVVSISALFSQRKDGVPPDSTYEVRVVKFFDEIKVSENIEAVVVHADTPDVRVATNNFFQKNVITELEGSALKIYLKDNFGSEDFKVRVTIDCPDIKVITASAGAQIKIDDGLKQEYLEIHGHTNGKIDIKHAEVDRVLITLSEGSRLNIHGSANKEEVKINTGGHLSAMNLPAKDVEIRITAGGYAEVRANEKFDGKTAMGGTIRWVGEAEEVTQTTTMGGSIERLKEE